MLLVVTFLNVFKSFFIHLKKNLKPKKESSSSRKYKIFNVNDQKPFKTVNIRGIPSLDQIAVTR